MVIIILLQFHLSKVDYKFIFSLLKFTITDVIKKEKRVLENFVDIFG